MSDHFAIVTTRAGCAVVHTHSHKEILRDLTPDEAKVALAELQLYDGASKVTDARLISMRHACKRAIARAEVK